MKKTRASLFCLVFGMGAQISEGAEEAGKEYEKTGKYVSQWDTNYYAQGGVVIDGIAYFTASSNDYTQKDVPQKDTGFPFVVAFDAIVGHQTLPGQTLVEEGN